MLQRLSPLDAIFQALADPTRRGMIERLAQGPASIGELAEGRPMSISAVGQHVKVLERGGLVRTRKAGRLRVCRIVPGALDRIESWAAARRSQLEQRLDRLEAHLARDEAGGAG